MLHGERGETGFDPEDQETANFESLDEAIAMVQEECAHIYDNARNGDKLETIFDEVRDNYENDPHEYELLIQDLSLQLSGVDDEDSISDILDQFARKAKDLKK